MLRLLTWLYINLDVIGKNAPIFFVKSRAVKIWRQIAKFANYKDKYFKSRKKISNRGFVSLKQYGWNP